MKIIIYLCCMGQPYHRLCYAQRILLHYAVANIGHHFRPGGPSLRPTTSVVKIISMLETWVWSSKGLSDLEWISTSYLQHRRNCHNFNSNGLSRIQFNSVHSMLLCL